LRVGGLILYVIGALGCSVLAITLLPGLALGLALAAGSHRTVYERANSPDDWHQARVQFDDAGAVSSYARLVFVKHTWNLSDEPLLSCRAFWANGEAKVRLSWIDSSTLLIEHHFAPNDVKAVASHCGPVRIITRAERPYEA
jgi:hypothetical protein